MKYIRDYKLFESKEFDDIKNDIEGILVELIDKGFVFNVYKGVVNIKRPKDPNAYYNTFSIDSDVEGLVIKIENTEIKINDIEDYVLTVIDYIKMEWDISEIVIYDSNRFDWWNMSTQFSKKFNRSFDWFRLNKNSKINNFAISIKKG